MIVLKHAAAFLYLLFCGYAGIMRAEAQSLPPVGQVYFEKLPEKHQLTSLSVLTIFKDHRGFIWIGTLDGLNCYDGYAIKSYVMSQEHDDGALPSQQVECIAEDARHNLWMLDVFHQKLFFLDATRRHFYTVKLPVTGINKMMGDAGGQVWLFSGSHAYRWQESLKTFLATAFPGGEKWNMLLNDRGRLMAQKGDLLWTLNDNAWKQVSRDDNIPEAASIYNFVLRVARQHSANAPEEIKDLVMVSDTTCWIATANNGIYVASKKDRTEPWETGNISLKHLVHSASKDHSLASNEITCLLRDDEGIIWVGTKDKGVNFYAAERFNFLNIVNVGTATHWGEIGTVRALEEDDHHNVWVGTQDNGVLVLDSNYNFIRSITRELTSKTIRSLCMARSGRVWIGHYDGLSCYDPRTGRITNDHLAAYRNDSTSHRVYEIKEDANSMLWISLWNYLVWYDPHTGKSRLVNFMDSTIVLHEPIKIRCFDFDKKGTLWIGTENYGLFAYNTITGKSQNFSQVSPRRSRLPDDNIFKISFTRKGRLLLATSSGLCLFDPHTCTSFVPRPDVNYKRTYAALEDNRGAIWISTVNGMWCYLPGKDTIEMFDHTDGLSSNEFTKNGLLQRADGQIVFGCNNGIIAFDPGRLSFSTTAPRLLLRYDDKFTSTAAPISLSYNQRSFRLEANVLSFQAPARNTLAYRLRGWEKNWNYQPAGNPVIYYEHFPEGDYELEIKGMIRGRSHATAGITIPIHKSAPFWRTPLFFIFSLVVVIGATYWFQKRKILYLEREKQMQRKHYESELNLLKSQISPHFLFNTLNNIYSLCILDPPRAGEMVMKLSHMLRYMLYECNQDRVNLEKELSFLENYVFMVREKIAPQSNVSFTIEGNTAGHTIVPFLLINFVENSIKHGDLRVNPLGFVRITVTIHASQLMFEIANTFINDIRMTATPGGLGLEHVRRRLTLFYPDAHALSIHTHHDTYYVQLILRYGNRA